MQLQAKPDRVSVDLSQFPDLVVIYLGMKVTAWRGIKTLVGMGRGIDGAVAAQPDGLLAHEMMMFSLTHIGMRQYWRDFESLELFTRSEPHQTWWRAFAKDHGGTGFWHETYRMQGGMEAIYLSVPQKLGFLRFAPQRAPQGPFMTARQRLK